MSETKALPLVVLKPPPGLKKPKAAVTVKAEMLAKCLRDGWKRGQIADFFGINYRQLGELIEYYGLDPRRLAAFNECRADLLASTQSRIINSIDDDVIAKSTLRDRAHALSTLHNAERLERGQSTSNVNVHLLTAELTELEKIKDELEAELAKLVGKPPAAT